MAKRFSSVSQMARDLTDDEAFHAALEKEIADKSVAKTLFALRCANGVTQKEMARRLGVTQSRISKLESSSADVIKVSDLVAYSKALNLGVLIAFQKGPHREMNAVDCIKYHLLQIKKQLDYLAGLAHKDDDISKGVAEFFASTFVNFMRLFNQSVDKLPQKEAEDRTTLDICLPVEMEV